MSETIRLVFVTPYFLQENPRETFKEWLLHHGKAYQEGGVEVCFATLYCNFILQILLY